MATGRVGHAASSLGITVMVGEVESEFRPEDGGQADVAGGEGEAHGAVETVVIGEGETRKPETRGFVDELLGMAGTVEE